VDLVTIQKEIQNKKIFELRQIANQLGVKNVKTMTKQELIDAILKLAEAELQGEQKPGETKPQSSAQPTEVKDRALLGREKRKVHLLPLLSIEVLAYCISPMNSRVTRCLRANLDPRVWTFTCPYHRRGN